LSGRPLDSQAVPAASAVVYCGGAARPVAGSFAEVNLRMRVIHIADTRPGDLEDETLAGVLRVPQRKRTQ
jgi:hypothetical protein